jgi:hypothetical protein
MFLDSQIWMNRLMDDRHFINITKLRKKVVPNPKSQLVVFFLPILFPYFIVFFFLTIYFYERKLYFPFEKKPDIGTDFGLGSSVYFFKFVAL